LAKGSAGLPRDSQCGEEFPDLTEYLTTLDWTEGGIFPTSRVFKFEGMPRLKDIWVRVRAQHHRRGRLELFFFSGLVTDWSHRSLIRKRNRTAWHRARAQAI
jgi:hypothetical protein